MKITEVRIDKSCDTANGLVGVFTVVLDDCLAIHGIKVVRAKGDGFLQIVMPSRCHTRHCGHCGRNNPVDSYFCNRCGGTVERVTMVKIHTDVVHPTRNALRNQISEAILRRYRSSPGRDCLPSAEQMILDRHGG